jgi:hypothetical protein
MFQKFETLQIVRGYRRSRILRRLARCAFLSTRAYIIERLYRCILKERPLTLTVAPGHSLARELCIQTEVPGPLDRPKLANGQSALRVLFNQPPARRHNHVYIARGCTLPHALKNQPFNALGEYLRSCWKVRDQIA